MLMGMDARLWRIDGDGSLCFNTSSVGQRQFIESIAEELLFSGHYGNGKSIAMCVKAWMLCQLYPGIQGALVRRLYADLRTSTIKHFRRVLGEALYQRGLLGGERPERYDFDNGSQIHFIGITGDNNSTDKLLSTEFGFIFADECNELTEDQWDRARGRLRQPGIPIAQMAGSCNPDHPQHWLYFRFQPDLGSNRQIGELERCPTCVGTKRLRRAWIDDDTGEISETEETCPRCAGAGEHRPLERECIVAGMNDNDAFIPTQYLRYKKGLRGVKRKRYFEGKWVAFEGQVYDEFDPEVHCKDRPQEWTDEWGGQPPPEWPRYLGIDFGFTAPFVCQWWARDPEKTLWLYREIYMTGRIVAEHAKEIHRLNALERAAIAEAWWERAERECADPWEWRRVRDTLTAPVPRIRAIYADHDAEDRATLTSCNIGTQTARKEKKAGRDHVTEALAIYEVEVDGRTQRRSHLYFLKDARGEVDDVLLGPPRLPTRTIEEFGAYKWLPAKEGRSAKEETVDFGDHGMDAMRYVVHTLRTVGDAQVFGLRD